MSRDRSGDRRRCLSGMLYRREIARQRGRTPAIDRIEQDVHIGELVGGDTEQRGPDPRRETDADHHHLGRHGFRQRSRLRTDHDHLAGDGPEEIDPPVREHAQVWFRRAPEFASPETLHEAGERGRWSVLAIGKTVSGRRHLQPTLTGGGSAVRHMTHSFKTRPTRGARIAVMKPATVRDADGLFALTLVTAVGG